MMLVIIFEQIFLFYLKVKQNVFSFVALLLLLLLLRLLLSSTFLFLALQTRHKTNKQVNPQIKSRLGLIDWLFAVNIRREVYFEAVDNRNIADRQSYYQLGQGCQTRGPRSLSMRPAK